MITSPTNGSQYVQISFHHFGIELKAMHLVTNVLVRLTAMHSVTGLVVSGGKWNSSSSFRALT